MIGTVLRGLLFLKREWNYNLHLPEEKQKDLVTCVRWPSDKWLIREPAWFCRCHSGSGAWLTVTNLHRQSRQVAFGWVSDMVYCPQAASYKEQGPSA